jgi:hypothetical protein
MEKSKIENIFNECLENLISGKETIEQCLKRYPDQAGELEPLLRTAVSLNKAVDIEPAPETKARIRYNLQRKIAETGVPRKPSWFSLQPRWALSAVAIMFMFVVGGSTFLFADSSMPGSLLYPVKLFTENLSIKLAGSDTAKAELSLTFADRRIDEMDYMLQNSTYNEARVDEVSNSYIAYVDSVNTLTYGSEANTSSSMEAAGTQNEEAATSPRLTSGAATTSPSESEKSTESTEPPEVVTGSVPPQISLAVPPDESADASLQPVNNEQYELYNKILYYADKHPKKLEKWLDDPGVPEQYKIMIRRMLADVKNLKHK